MVFEGDIIHDIQVVFHGPVWSENGGEFLTSVWESLLDLVGETDAFCVDCCFLFDHLPVIELMPSVTHMACAT